MGINPMSQASFAKLAKVNQTTISRWENGLTDVSCEQMANIRNAALERKLLWSDSLFFETPGLPSVGDKRRKA